MTFLTYGLYFAALIVAALVLALWMIRVYGGLPALAGVERAFLRASGANPTREMTWGNYAMAVLAFNLVCFLMLYTILRGHPTDTVGALGQNARPRCGIV
jgi:potassium-transporting ATPase potassium-binding subunit